MIQTAAQLIGILMIFYSFFEGGTGDKMLGIAIGTGMLILSTLIKQKHMLIITAAGVLLGGISLKESWLILLAIYIFIASFFPTAAIHTRYLGFFSSESLLTNWNHR